MHKPPATSKYLLFVSGRKNLVLNELTQGPKLTETKPPVIDSTLLRMTDTDIISKRRVAVVNKTMSGDRYSKSDIPSMNTRMHAIKLIFSESVC